MNIKSKTLGLVFIGDLEIKEMLIREILFLSKNYDINIIPIIKEKYFYKNINKFLKITKNKPIFYDKGIIMESAIKNFDFLILMGCGANIIYKLSNRIYDNNILKIVKFGKFYKIPIIVGINIKNFNSVVLTNLESLYNKKECFFIPFKITNPITNFHKVSFDYNLINKTFYQASNKMQIEPLISIL